MQRMVVVRRTIALTSIALTLLALIAGAVGPAAAAALTVVAITIDGVRQNILILAPASPPLAAVVMFPGGNGLIGIGDDGAIARGGNFLVRTRALWLAQGFLFVAVDAAPGRAGRRGDRIGPANQLAVAEIVRAIRRRTAAPIWLVGTSAGAPAALAGAASLPAGSIQGVVISSPVSVPGPRDSVFDVALRRIAVPVLIQVHRNDGCRLSPPANASAIQAALTAAPAVSVQVFAGGAPSRSSACEAFAQHGFLGLEGQVVDAAAKWIKDH